MHHVSVFNQGLEKLADERLKRGSAVMTGGQIPVYG